MLITKDKISKSLRQIQELYEEEKANYFLHKAFY